mgnify:CR=1 FL=1
MVWDMEYMKLLTLTMHVSRVLLALLCYQSTLVDLLLQRNPNTFPYISSRLVAIAKFVQSQQLDVPGESNLAKPLNYQWLDEGR